MTGKRFTIDVEEQLYLQDLLKEKQNLENDNL